MAKVFVVTPDCAVMVNNEVWDEGFMIVVAKTELGARCMAAQMQGRDADDFYAQELDMTMRGTVLTIGYSYGTIEKRTRSPLEEGRLL